MPEPSSDGVPDTDSFDLEQRVRLRITPSPELLAEIAHARELLVEASERAARELGLPMVRAVVAGSAARGTFLGDRLDLDLFLLFPPDHPRDALEKDGLAVARKVLVHGETRYAEHPYLRGQFGGRMVDAVPGYAISDPAHPQSAVDRTPFHQAYLAPRLTPELIAEVRLAKQFLRGIGVYGAESRTQGFSGYLVELLILRFGSLRGLLREARAWRAPVRIEYTRGSSPRVPPGIGLILDDPVDPHRNVASAVSPRSLAILQLAAREYLRRPTPEFFELHPAAALEREAAIPQIRDRGTHVVGLALPRPDLVDDILYPQLLKGERAVGEEAARCGFRPIGTASAAGEDRILFLLEVEHGELPSVLVRSGPPTGVDRTGSFLEKWGDPSSPRFQGPYVRSDGTLAVEIHRPLRSVEASLTDALSRIPLGRDLSRLVRPEHKFEPLTSLPPSPELSLALGALLSKRLPWVAR